MTQQRAAILASELDAILDTAQPGDDPTVLELVRMASRRLHGFVARQERESMGMAMLELERIRKELEQ